jgi:hypothetical protein
MKLLTTTRLTFDPTNERSAVENDLRVERKMQEIFNFFFIRHRNTNLQIVVQDEGEKY